VFVAIEIKAMLIGQSVEAPTRDAIRKFINERPEIGEIFNVITLQLGNDIMVAVQASPADPTLSTAANIVRINAVEAALRARFTDVKWCFFEMDDSD
jgi:divalent metal cation (Fe/Co/Zn/Cd) transporter